MDLDIFQNILLVGTRKFHTVYKSERITNEALKNCNGINTQLHNMFPYFFSKWFIFLKKKNRINETKIQNWIYKKLKYE